MPFVMGLPLLFIILPTGLKNIAVYCVVYTVIYLLVRRHLSVQGDFKRASVLSLKRPAASVLLSAGLGYAFYGRWLTSRSLVKLFSHLGLRLEVFLAGFAVLLSLICIWSIDWVLDWFVARAGCCVDTRELNRAADEPAAKMDGGEWLLCAFAALGLGAALLFSCPLWGQYSTTDSSVFIYIGKGMLAGKIPYVDLFDHKGPILYFIQVLGLVTSLPGTYSGLWLIECAELFVTVVSMYKTAKLLTKSRLACWLVVLLVLLGYGRGYFEGGNFTETHALPCVAVCIYVYTKYFLTLRYRRAEIVALGVCCAVVAFIRINMAAPWLALTPVVIFFMCRQRAYKDIAVCIGCFAGGMLAVCVPVAVYLIRTGSLEAMIEYYFRFNVHYSSDQGSIVNQLASASDYLFAGNAICTWLILLSTLLYWEKLSRPLRRAFGCNLWGLLATLYFATMSGRGYPHYAVVLLPLFVIHAWCLVGIAVHALKRPLQSRISPRIRQRLTPAIVCLVIAVSVFPVLSEASVDRTDPIDDYLIRETREDDDVLIISAAGYYLDANRKTENKFFYQYPPLRISDALYEEFLQELSAKPSDVILFTDIREIWSSSGNFLKLLHSLDEQCQQGAYSYEEYDSFFVYRWKGEDL